MKSLHAIIFFSHKYASTASFVSFSILSETQASIISTREWYRMSKPDCLLFWLMLLAALNALLKWALKMVTKEEKNSSVLPSVMHRNGKVKKRSVTCQLCPHSINTSQAWGCLVSSVIKDLAFSSGAFFEKNGREIWLSKEWKWKMTRKN